MSIIVHITNRNVWEASARSGYYKAPSLESEGFIHCSTIEQTADTANRYYADQKDLVLLCIDKNKLEPTVKYESPACVNDQRTGSLFPHIYGPLNISAVIRVVKFVPNADGAFEVPVEVRQLT